MQKMRMASVQTGHVRTDQSAFLKAGLDSVTLSAVTFRGRLAKLG